MALEGAEDALLSASGMCSATTLLLALVPAGGHVVTTTDCYRRTRQFMQTVLPKMGIGCTVIDPSDLAALERALAQQQARRGWKRRGAGVAAGGARAWRGGRRARAAGGHRRPRTHAPRPIPGTQYAIRNAAQTAARPPLTPGGRLLLRVPHQPLPPLHRRPARVGAVPRGRHGRRRRQHVCDARQPARARPGRRPRRALGHQVRLRCQGAPPPH
jgi:hypothetical protein